MMMNEILGKVYRVDGDHSSMVIVFFSDKNNNPCNEEKAKMMHIQIIEKGVKKYSAEGEINDK